MASMERLTSVNGSFPARVLAARLHSEGLDCELRGALDSVYRLTVGDMARVDVFVPADQMDDARLVMLVDEVDAAYESDEPPSYTSARSWLMWTAVAAVVFFTVAPLVRALFAS
jgi:primosomal protein N'